MPLTMDEVSAAEGSTRNPDLKPEDLTVLRAWLDTQKHLPPISDEMLILFLHSCYYNMEKTKDCIETYYTLRTNTPEFFSDRDVSKPALAKALSALHLAVMPKLDPRGYVIAYHGLKDYEPSTYIFVEDIKLVVMTMDSCLLTHGPSEGLVILFNMQGVRLSHLTRISLSPLRKFFNYIQDGNPVRLKGIYVINVVPFVDKIMTLVKPFMKKELMNLLYFHTGDMESFYKLIPKECLPSDFGGDLASVEELSAKGNERLLGLADYFAEEEKFRVDEKKRQKRKKNSSKKDLDIDFEKLEID